MTHSHKVLPMNSGAEAVETAIKAVRKWGYKTKGVPEDQAEVIVCEQNFHGRTISIISFSSDATATADFGPFTAWFPHDPLWRRKGPARGHHPQYGGLFWWSPSRARPGVIIPPAGVPERGAPDLR